MPASLFPIALDIVGSQWLLIPAVGVASAGVALVIGRSLFGRRQIAPRSPKKDSPPAPPDPFVHGSATERRIALRRSGKAVEVLITDAEVKEEPSRGWVVDRSTGGLCLEVIKEVEPGTVLSVRTVNAPKTVSWVQVEVKSCRAVDGNWEIGCQFVKTPPWSVMLLFG
jgi:hypothetical protein